MLLNVWNKFRSSGAERDPLYSEAVYLQHNPDVRSAVQNAVFPSGYRHFEKYGKNEGRVYGVDASGHFVRAGSDRNARFFRFLKRDGAGLEIGPSHSPIAPKRDGFNVKVVDHLSAAGLRSKYADHQGVNVDNIEEVDYVWSGEPLSQLISDQKFDWVIASHVLEHVPNPIAFLQEIALLLKPDGVLSIALPDKRFCFDYFKSVTLVGEWVDALHFQRTRPTPGQVLDHCFYAAQRNGRISWDATEKADAALVHEPTLGRDVLSHSLSTTEYTDVHCWRFTSDSFKLLINELRYLQFTKLGICESPFMNGGEFLVSLRLTDEPVLDFAQRQALIKQVLE